MNMPLHAFGDLVDLQRVRHKFQLNLFRRDALLCAPYTLLAAPLLRQVNDRYCLDIRIKYVVVSYDRYIIDFCVNIAIIVIMLLKLLGIFAPLAKIVLHLCINA